MIGECDICGAKGEIRHISLYVSGSEGINPCHACEMAVVNFVQSMRSVATRAKLNLIKRQKNLNLK